MRSVKPSANAEAIPTDVFVSAELLLPNGGVNTATISSQSVSLVRVSTNALVPAVVNTSGGGDVIVLRPKSALAPNAQYRFVVTASLQDVQGVGFLPFSSSFTTGAATSPPPSSAARFTQVAQATSAGRSYFGMAIGPDGRLYAGSDDGRIYRFTIAADGTLGAPSAFDIIRSRNGGNRFIVGLAFDPRSTAANPILWVTHSATSSLVLGGTVGADLTGKVSVVSGASLGGYRDAVINLPRSVRDHMTMQPTFGPDGALYFCQASQSAMGKADVIWGNRPERLLSAAILRLDVGSLGNGTVNALTPDAGGDYNPSAGPLTIYADGVRNAFDLVWHSNGSLYAPTNGSAAGGNTPLGGGAPSIMGVGSAESDFLFRISRGGYYGHPNPQRGHYVLNGGNPTAGNDPYEVDEYPVGQKPDPNWRPAIFNFGAHHAPSGTLEYRGDSFGGALDGRLLVTRYSGGDDIIALTIGPGGGVTKAETGIPGLTGLADPVDLVQSPGSGNLYVIELAKKRITLLRANSVAVPPPVPPTVPPAIPPTVPPVVPPTVPPTVPPAVPPTMPPAVPPIVPPTVPPAVPPAVPPSVPPVVSPPPPAVLADLTPLITKVVMPASIAHGSPFKGTLAFRVSNGGDISLSGLIPISVRLSADTAVSPGDTEVAQFFKSVRLKPGQSSAVKLKITSLPAVAAGNYHLSVFLDPADTMTEANETNNTAASVQVIAVSAPTVDLSGVFTVGPSNLVIGKQRVIKLSLSAGGNVPVNGTIIIQVVASLDATAGAGDIDLGAVPANVKMMPGSTKSVSLKVLLPANMTPAIYHVIATIDSPNLIPESIENNNAAVTNPLILNVA